MILWVYDRWGNQINAIGDFQDLAFDDELGSLDYIEFKTPDQSLIKGDYLVWRDEFGVWHEHIVRSVELSHSEGMTLQSVYAVNSISELNLSYKGERDSYNLSNVIAWDRLLEDTRWIRGTVENLGSGNIKFYHCTIYEGIVQIVSIWGGEISTNITVGSNGVISRSINHQKTRGSDDGLLFTYGFDMDNIVRQVELDEVYTRIHVFGKGEANYDEGGNTATYSRRISFADINGGKDYVEDNTAMQTWGVVGKNGVKQHSEGVFIFEDCEDKAELLSLAKEKLNEVKEPRITYSANVAILTDAGMDFKNARTGDACYIRDKELDIRLSGRITHLRRYPTSTKPSEITLGNIRRTVREVFQEQSKAISELQTGASHWDSAVEANQAWLKNMLQNLNNELDVGGAYVNIDETDGLTVTDKPRDKNPTRIIQLKGGALRIANKKKSNGEWDWTTAATGDGFIADVLVAGAIVCGANRIDLDSGTITLKDGTIVANVIKGGTLTLGGYSNGNGLMQVNSSTGLTIVQIDNSGIKMNSGSISLSDSFDVNVAGSLYARYPHFGGGIYTHGLGFGVDLTTADYKLMFYYLGSAFYLGNSEVSLWINNPTISGKLTCHGDISSLGSISAIGSISCVGTKSRRIQTSDNCDRLFYCYEMASPYFGDIGDGITDSNGNCVVAIDYLFSAGSNTSIQYQVFIQKLGKGDLYVKERNPDYFVVEGTPNLAFSWEIKARQMDYEAEHLEIYQEPEIINDLDIELQEAVQELANKTEEDIYEELI